MIKYKFIQLKFDNSMITLEKDNSVMGKKIPKKNFLVVGFFCF
jgi:hypothetical protein